MCGGRTVFNFKSLKYYRESPRPKFRQTSPLKSTTKRNHAEKTTADKKMQLSNTIQNIKLYLEEKDFKKVKK
jgi:hypothetical protein